MRVRVNEKIKIFHGHVPVELEKGQEVTGSLAALLAARAPKKVTLLDAPEPETEEDDGQEQDEPPADSDGPADVVDEFDPDATAAAVLDWVDEDPGRAATALAAEQTKDRPRSTLVKQLEKLAETEQ